MNPVGAQEERRVGVGGLVGRGAVDNLAVLELLVGEEVASPDAEAHGRRKIDRSEVTAVALVGALLARRVDNEVPQHLARGLQAGRVGVDCQGEPPGDHRVDRAPVYIHHARMALCPMRRLNRNPMPYDRPMGTAGHESSASRPGRHQTAHGPQLLVGRTEPQDPVSDIQ